MIGAIRAGREPVEIRWKSDRMGMLGAKAWREQKKIGWTHMLRGRLSKTWSEMQEHFYRDHPDYRHKKTCTGLGWAVRMIKELTAMLLEMWASRCGCLHGHTKEEKKRRRKEGVAATVRKCYGRRGEVVIEHQDIFDEPLEEMLRDRSVHYLRAWVNMFYSLVLLSDRIRGRRGQREVQDDSSVDTFDTMDLAEYLVDATDGMDREWDVDDWGAVQTPPRPMEIELQEALDDGRRGKVRNPYKKVRAVNGSVELNKRKPPDRGSDGSGR